MPNPVNTTLRSSTCASYDLRDLTNELLQELVQVAGKNRSFFINDIPRDLYLGTDPALVSIVLRDLLLSMAVNSKDSCIHLNAKLYSDVILVHVKDCSTYNSYAIESGLQRIQPVVEKMGGFLNITSLRKKVTTVAFCFPNIPLAA